MTLVLDPPRRHGQLRFAVLCDRAVVATSWPQGIAGHGRKMPAAVIFADETGLHARDLSGRALNIDVLEAACPGLVATMTAAAGE